MAADHQPQRDAWYPLVLALFAVVAYVAFVVCAFGFASLYGAGNVIDEAEAGPLVGPVMVASATIVLFFALLMIGAPMSAASRRIPVGRVLGAAFAVTAAYLLSGALAYSTTTAQLLDAVLFFGHHLVRPFTFAVAGLAFLVALLYVLVLLRRLHGGRRPLWPWEKHGD
ncbi:DUF6121 family protein [Luethyella okanaganae]|uniref:DUF6121 family protein n=1 Tax=Luethyella okanaganae TaxID=69372 RepID=A0ABW1VIE0_9MICO